MPIHVAQHAAGKAIAAAGDHRFNTGNFDDIGTQPENGH
jgi:hypothetical protein